MRSHIVRVPVVAMAMFLFAAAAAQAQVCVRIDEAHDTLNASDRSAALLLLTREFESAGEQVVADCATPYVLGHIRLGNTITVTLMGPKGEREGTALGLDDLPALYNQMVRSLATGRSMTGLGVVDRSNVTASQASARRVHSDSFTYARLGYGSIFGDRTYSMPSFGFGYRAELDSLAIDVSFLNFQVGSSNDYYASSSASAGSLLKLAGLYFVNPKGNATPYFGGGLSWGGRSFNNGRDFNTTSYATNGYSSGWHGSGLQGELTAGYEFARATTVRLFVQADAVLPFYSATSETISRTGLVTTTSRRYAPSLIMSVGMGWQKNRK